MTEERHASRSGSGQEICAGCKRTFTTAGAFMNHTRYKKDCTQELRFWGKVDKSGGPDACWPWLGAQQSDGYGQVGGWKNGRRSTLNSHRVAYEFVLGKIPDGMHTLHSCDVRHCCNPAHMSLGTNADNVADKVSKDRHSRGELNAHHKLTEADVLAIRAEYARNGGRLPNAKALAAKYGIKPNSIVNAAAGRTWSYLNDR